MQQEEDTYILATSAAYELQQLYTGFEKIIERYFQFKGDPAPPGQTYHKTLLTRAIEEKLISEGAETDFLIDLLAFRHVVRAAYGVLLRPDETLSKVKGACLRWPLIAAQLKQAISVSLGRAQNDQRPETQLKP